MLDGAGVAVGVLFLVEGLAVAFAPCQWLGALAWLPLGRPLKFLCERPPHWVSSDSETDATPSGFPPRVLESFARSGRVAYDQRLRRGKARTVVRISAELRGPELRVTRRCYPTAVVPLLYMIAQTWAPDGAKKAHACLLAMVLFVLALHQQFRAPSLDIVHDLLDACGVVAEPRLLRDRHGGAASVLNSPVGSALFAIVLAPIAVGCAAMANFCLLEVGQKSLEELVVSALLGTLLGVMAAALLAACLGSIYQAVGGTAHLSRQLIAACLLLLAVIALVRVAVVEGWPALRGALLVCLPACSWAAYVTWRELRVRRASARLPIT